MPSEAPYLPTEKMRNLPHWGFRWQLGRALKAVEQLSVEGKKIDSLQGSNLRSLRHATGLKVKELRSLTGLSNSAIQHIEEMSGASLDSVKTYLQTLLAVVESQDIQPDSVMEWLKVPFSSWISETSPLSALLDPELRLVPFHGSERKEQLNRLTKWCLTQDSLGIESFRADAGMGKTRLAVELCHELAHQPEEDRWSRGFLQGEKFPKGPGDLALQAPSNKNLLIVVDYAGRPEQLKAVRALLPQLDLKSKKHHWRRVRLLLLDRDDFWLGELKVDKCCAQVLSPANFRRTFSNPALADAVPTTERAKIFESATRAFAERIGGKVPPGEKPDLRKPLFDRPLLLHMLALLFVSGDPNCQKSEREILDTMLDRERRLWRGALQARGLQPPLETVLEKMFKVLSTHGGARTNSEALEILKNVRGFRDLAEHLQDQLLDILQGFYGSASAFIDPLRPDLLGESFISRPVRKRSCS